MSSLSARDVARTVQWIGEQQQPDGSIPWSEGRHVDPWDHVEAAMALDVGGLHAEARRAYEWLARTQRGDGAWPASLQEGRVLDPTLDANFVAYCAAGVWHHFLATQDEAFVAQMWPMIEQAMGFVLELQSADGGIYWARDSKLRAWPRALVTSCSCIHLSLRCALALAELVGKSQPEWELALGALSDALTRTPPSFEPKKRFAMDWYYPVLGGGVRGEAAVRRLDERWDTFVVPGLGARCVSDRPWVTTAETCELAIALAAVGRYEDATLLLRWVQHLRGEDGAYWTGATFPDGTRWPVERTTWSAAAVVLAADVLQGSGPTSAFFGDAGPAAGAGTSLGRTLELPSLRYSTRCRTRRVSSTATSTNRLESSARR